MNKNNIKVSKYAKQATRRRKFNPRVFAKDAKNINLISKPYEKLNLSAKDHGKPVPSPANQTKKGNKK